MAELIASAAVGFAGERTSAFAEHLASVADWTQEHTSAPGMMSGLAEARLLEALIVVSGARRVLEIGTFTGVGTLTMAAALPEGGRVTTLEVDPETAATARRHFDASPHAARIELIVGDALKTLTGLDGPFDLVYIDAWKTDYPNYYEAVLPKLSPRGIIVGDNLFRGGTTLDPSVDDEATAGMREFARRVQADERVHNVLLTIGDGVMLAWQRPDSARS
jgi:caffeoyl-CoA O-methyltransferase